jgi:hypothetical protein
MHSYGRAKVQVHELPVSYVKLDGFLVNDQFEATLHIEVTSGFLIPCSNRAAHFPGIYTSSWGILSSVSGVSH